MASGPDKTEIRIGLVDKEQDFNQGFDCIAAAFGKQVEDGIWIAMNPGWDTPEGRIDCIRRLVLRWRNATQDRNGDANTVFLKASVPESGNGTTSDRVVGLAIWQQLAVVPGRGDAPASEQGMKQNAAEIRPDSEHEQRYLFQLDSSLHRRRAELVQEKENEPIPAVMVLDLCVVDPTYQGRGIAKRLVQWGLDEAERRGGLEAITEASAMGRHVYNKLGFQQEGPEIEYAVDAEFAERKLPSNIFMRTQLQA